MSLRAASLAAAMIGFPRVSGDEPNTELPRRAFVMFSPRERG